MFFCPIMWNMLSSSGTFLTVKKNGEILGRSYSITHTNMTGKPADTKKAVSNFWMKLTHIYTLFNV